MAAAHRGRRLSRRAFMQGAGALGLGLLAGCGRLPGQAPPPTPRLGFLTANASNDLSTLEQLEGFRRGLQDHGYMEGQNIAIEYRYADGRIDSLPALATELVRLPVDIIVTASTSGVLAAKGATSTIPIVMTGTPNPVEAGLVDSLARPGGNVTGLTDLAVGLSAKRLELLKEAAVSVTRVGVLWQSDAIGNAVQLTEIEDAAKQLGMQVQRLGIRGPDDLDSALDLATSERVDALVTTTGPLMFALTTRIAELVTNRGLPAISPVGRFARSGGLMAYGPRLTENHVRAAYFVDRILKGARPTDLPIEQPTRFEFVINLKTAQALGLTIPKHVLLQATEIIQ